MIRKVCLLFGVCLLAHGPLATPLSAAEPQSKAYPASPNAAVIYWQAFAMMPTLEGEEKAKYEAAIKTTTEPVSNGLKTIVAHFSKSLRELHRARSISTCDWNLDYDAGPGMLLPHLSKARDLSRAALLRARLRFATGKTDAAIEDVVAVLKLARNCGGSPVLVSLMVDAAIEDMATDVLAANLMKLTPQQLDNLVAALKTLPATTSLADCLRVESDVLHMEGINGSAVARVIEREKQVLVRRTLLALAVQVQRHGSEVVKSALDSRDGTVEYHKTEAGFELRYQHSAGGKPEVLQIGGK